jgi:UDP-N-acetylmuramyl tripeptide synthase
MDLPDTAIAAGLSNFKPDQKDNPGRSNEFTHNGARVFVDFAHNPHSIAAVCDAMFAIPAKRRFIMLSHAGDRSDQDIHDVTLTALRFKPDIVVAVEIEHYLRGRELGEIPPLIKRAAVDAGLKPDQVRFAESPKVGARFIMDQLQPDDLALLLVLAERDEVFQLLQGGDNSGN